MSNVFIPYLGHTVHLVDREQLRFKRHGRNLSIPRHLRALADTIPTPPSTFDWSQGEKISYPILGNDQYGDCFYAAVCHMSQSFTGNASTEYSFNESSVISRYLRIAGGDNGLDDDTIFPEWEGGIVGPNGPRKILDEMTIDPNDDSAIHLGMWLFCGAILTVSLPGDWANNAAPGAIWDDTGSGSVGGHAIILTGVNSNGNYDLRTWGISPPIKLTPAGLKSASPEVVVAFSMDMFNSTGYAPCGLHYVDVANYWKALGGKQMPANPFAPPIPPTPPVVVPTTPYTLRCSSNIPAGVCTINNIASAFSSPLPAGDYLVTHKDPLPQ